MRYPLQYSLASMVAQTVKNTPAMQQTWVRPLGWEDPLEEGTATHSSMGLEKPHGLRSLADYRSCGPKELDMTERLSTQHTHTK